MTNTKGILSFRTDNADLVDKQFDRAINIERSELLKKNVKPDKKVFPLVLHYNPILSDIQKVIQRHVHLLRSSPELLEIFPSKSIFPAYRRTKNLKDILAPSKFGRDGEINQAGREMGGCLKCSSRCDLCKNFLTQDSKFKSFSTGRTYKVNQNLSCSSKNVVYLASCIKCVLYQFLRLHLHFYVYYLSIYNYNYNYHYNYNIIRLPTLLNSAQYT